MMNSLDFCHWFQTNIFQIYNLRTDEWREAVEAFDVENIANTKYNIKSSIGFMYFMKCGYIIVKMFVQ